MIVRAFSFVEMFDRALVASAHLVTKGVDHANAINVSEAEFLDWRLIEDMASFSFQIRVVLNFAVQWPARFCGVDVPEDVPENLDVTGLKHAIENGRGYLNTFTADQFAGKDELPLEFLIGGTMPMTLTRGRWLSGFCATNLYFHLSTAYAILRAKGANLSKVDLFAGGL